MNSSCAALAWGLSGAPCKKVESINHEDFYLKFGARPGSFPNAGAEPGISAGTAKRFGVL